MTDAPVSGRNFTVRVTELGPRGGARDEWDLSCSQVILPTLRVVKRRNPLLPPTRPEIPTDDEGPDPDDLLVLRRGHTGSTELYDWWERERAALFTGSHNVAVTVHDDAGHAVTTWGFEGCHLHNLRYSPLDAMHSEFLVESAEVTFTTVAQFGQR